MTLYLLRHCALRRPGPGRWCIGQTDYPLSDEGHAQAASLSRAFAQMPLDAIHCSDLARCVQTAAAIAAPHGLVPLPLALAREIHMGSWDGQPFADIQARFPREYAARGQALDTFRAPGGETFREVAARGLALLEQLAAAAAPNSLVVAHAGFNRALLCTLLGRPLDSLLQLPQPYGCVNRLQRTNGRWSVEAMAQSLADILDGPIR